MVPTKTVWPMPLPYHKSGSAGSEISEETAALRDVVNLQVCYLNYLRLGAPSAPPSHICGPVPLTAEQWDVVARISELAQDWLSQPIFEANDLGRTAAKQERQEAILSSLTEYGESTIAGFAKYRRRRRPVSTAKQTDKRGVVIGKVKHGKPCMAQQIFADRIKMEGKPSFDPTPFLDDDSKKLYNEPFSKAFRMLMLSMAPLVFGFMLPLVRSLNCYSF